MLNKIVLMGRLTRDPETRHTQSGKAVTSFTLACEQDFKGTDGKKPVDFIDCVAWEKRGEYVSQFCHKGDMLVVYGRLTIRGWTDKDGSRRSKPEVNIEGSYIAGGVKSPQRATERPLVDNYEDFGDGEEDLPW